MTDKTQALINQAVSDKSAADSVRGQVAAQEDVVHAADDKLTALQADALQAHNTALGSAHAAIAALTGELESDA